MKTDGPKRKAIKTVTQEQHQNVRNTRRTLKVLQQAATDKENLAGRPKLIPGKDAEADKPEMKHKQMLNKSVQTGECTITEADLTSDSPSEDYWRLLAEQRALALDESFKENEKLKEENDQLKEENKICKEMLDEAQNLVEVLQEMVNEHDMSTEVAEEATENI